MTVSNVSTLELTPREEAEIKRERALKDYRRGDPIRDIAIRYGKSTTAVSLWAKKAGLERRQQGCRVKKYPSATDIDIVNAVKASKANGGRPTLEEIGANWGYMSRAGVHRIYQKWKNWKPTIPFKAGDRIRLEGRDYLVLEPSVFTGKVRSLTTGKERVIGWGIERKCFRNVRGPEGGEPHVKESRRRIRAVKIN